MSEYLLESGKGGSIANVAYNPCGVSSTSQLLYKEFLNGLFKRGESCLGRAVFAAKCSIIARNPEDDSVYGPAVLWTLLGDPALRIRHRITTGIEEDVTPQAPSRMLTISPNPCNRSTTVRFAGSSFIVHRCPSTTPPAARSFPCWSALHPSSFGLHPCPRASTSRGACRVRTPRQPGFWSGTGSRLARRALDRVVGRAMLVSIKPRRPMPEMLSYCGIDCGACPALIATRTHDAALRAKTAAEWSKMFGHDFKPEEINCTGCTSDGAHVYYCDAMCEIRKCARKRKLANCAACADYGCATLAAFQKSAPETKTRLDAIRAGRGAA